MYSLRHTGSVPAWSRVLQTLVHTRLPDYESNQQDGTIQVNLLFLVGSTCFGRCFHPSSGAAGWCHGRVEM